MNLAIGLSNRAESAAPPPSAFALDVVILIATTAGGMLTAATLIHPGPGLVALADRRSGALAWLICTAAAAIGLVAGRRVRARVAARHVRLVALAVAAGLIWSALAWVRPTLGAGDGLVGQYFTNLTWSGRPASLIRDPNPSLAHIAGPNMIGQFSVRWAGFLTIVQPGLYTFATTSDDGSRLIVDDTLVVDNGGIHGPTTRSGSIRLARGAHPIVLEYMQYGGASVLEWTWSRDGATPGRVPPWALSVRPASYTTVRNARIVDWGLSAFAVLASLAAGCLLLAGLNEPVVGAGLFLVLFSAAMWELPWPDGAHQRLPSAVASTLGGLNQTAFAAVRRYGALQHELSTPGSGEEVLPDAVRHGVAMLREHRVDRYQMSDAIAADDWVYQQMVASAWPRRLEKDARARLIAPDEGLGPGCTLVEKQTDVSLVDCP